MQYTIDGTYLKIKKNEHFSSLSRPPSVERDSNGKCSPPYIKDISNARKCILCNNTNSLGDGDANCISCTDVQNMIIQPATNTSPAACVCKSQTVNVGGTCVSCMKQGMTNNYLKKTNLGFSCEAVPEFNIKYNVGHHDAIVKCPVGFKPDSDASTCIIAPETIKNDAYTNDGKLFVPPPGYKWISDGNGGIKIALSSN